MTSQMTFFQNFTLRLHPQVLFTNFPLLLYAPTFFTSFPRALGNYAFAMETLPHADSRWLSLKLFLKANETRYFQEDTLLFVV